VLAARELPRSGTSGIAEGVPILPVRWSRKISEVGPGILGHS
jgi:hypothetical protein